VDYAAFIETWCRWVPYTPGRERLSLREKSNLDCVFWGADIGDGAPDDGCSVYDARPLQCRAFPFWDSVMCSRGAWERVGKECPGMDSGRLYTREEIDGFLDRQGEELVIERAAPRAEGA